MSHEHKRNITCPHCDHECTDTWEFEKDNDTWHCGACHKEFNVTMHVRLTYSTSKITTKTTRK